MFLKKKVLKKHISLAPREMTVPQPPEFVKQSKIFHKTAARTERMRVKALKEALAILWEGLNRKKKKGVVPLLPLEVILSKILRPEGKRRAKKEPEFIQYHGRRYFTVDVQEISTIVQWCASAKGNALFETASLSSDPDRFVRAFAEMMRQEDIVTALMVKPDNNVTTLIPGSPIVRTPTPKKKPRKCRPRSLVLADAFMKWLGSREAEAFVKAYTDFTGRSLASVRKHTEERRAAAPMSASMH